jgi:ribulose-5-phosphate 4-epimerase/fuculose-1-phosphate aldolase
VGRTPGEAFLRMYYLDRACEIQITARAGGARLVLPSPEVSELAARQLAGEDTGSDLRDEQAAGLAWAALLRLAHRIAPDHTD